MGSPRRLGEFSEARKSLVQGYQIQKRKGEKQIWQEERKGVVVEKVFSNRCSSGCVSVLWLLLRSVKVLGGRISRKKLLLKS